MHHLNVIQYVKTLENLFAINNAPGRLNHPMILHTHKAKTDAIDCQAVLQEFVAATPTRTNLIKIH